MSIGRNSRYPWTMPYCHCIAHCVRRAFLRGKDAYSGQYFNHRRIWLVDRLKQQESAKGD